MNIDFHCHGKPSKKLSFSLPYFSRYIRMAKRNGLDAIAFTEHFNTMDFYDIYHKLDNAFPYADGYYDAYDVKVFCGMEINVKEGGHVLIIGYKKDILDIRALFPEEISKKDYPAFEHLMELADSRGMIKIGAHPFRNSNILCRHDEYALKQLDFIELNGKNIDQKDDVYDLARKINLPVIAGSDSHHWFQLGCMKNRLRDECDSFQELKDCIKSNRYDIDVSPHINLKLAMAFMCKKLIKSVYEK
ncbi:PHP domain-containing protein [Mahella sp.]|uniref:PHP domain-containing protein n=1 Tax=Mahella sp. TaxID=2798721 RepID=UPI0025BB1FE1|nr:PHP domain-containing protein [Mahella sp.]MBZ4665408.1 hypothetical protein [Mahella sp.]MDK2902662.1 hypothetical protein [Clostridiales bacterium]